MNSSTIISVIGATGRLAIPVVKALLAYGYQVRAVVRNPEKAKQLLPKEVIFAVADVHDVPSLSRALKGSTYVYINLSAEENGAKSSFFLEREGVKNIVEACQAVGVQQILKIGALGAHPSIRQPKEFYQNQIRREGHRYIEESGIPFTIFHPTWFLDSIEWAIKKDTLQWVGKPVEFYWTNSTDYAQWVAKAVGNPMAYYQHYVVQGREKMDYEAVYQRLKAQKTSLKLQVLPLWMVKMIGFFSPTMKSLADLFAFYEGTTEDFHGQALWKELGAPSTSLEVFFEESKGVNIPYL